MNGKKSRRAGATETFSVSVDPETKRALRALADKEFGVNLSALVTNFAEDARRRLAAGAYLRRHGSRSSPPVRRTGSKPRSIGKSRTRENVVLST